VKKIFMILFILIIFFGSVGYSSLDDSAHRTFTSSIATKSIVGFHTASGDSDLHVPEPISLVLLGSGLVALSLIGRKRFGK
jgi:hypothetical protein